MPNGKTPAYEPRVLTESWFEARSFILDVLKDVAGKTPYSPSDLGFSLTRLTDWALTSSFVDVEREVLLRRDVIDRFVGFGCGDLAPSVRGNVRSQLLRVAEVVLEPSLAQLRMTAIPRVATSAPYTRREIASMFSWAAGQGTVQRRADAHILIHLGLGAGLSASEIGNCRARDVRVDESGVFVSVAGDRSRVIPVVAEWQAGVADRALELGKEKFLFRPSHVAHYPNLVSNFISKGRTTEHSPQTQRLRATWIVRHLNAGTHVLPLMRAAGVESLEALTRFLQFVEPPDNKKAIEELRMTGTAS